MERNIESIESLLSGVAAAVGEVDPRIRLGLMTAGPGWTTYSGQALDRWSTALGATKARPGGGFYTDYTPLEMYHKAHECGRQRASLPPTVPDVQYELENFPYQRLKKSTAALVAECTLALAHGLNGVAFNLFGTPTSQEDYLPCVQAIGPARRLWQQWVRHAAGLPTAGLWPAWSSQLMARRSVRKGESWLSSSPRYDITRPLVLGEIGLPLACDRDGCGVVLSGRIAEAFDDKELKGMLAGGVLMDSTALDVLAERGLDRLTGVRLAERLDNGLMERFTADELNGPAVGQLRDARIEFWGDARGMGDVLEPVAEGVRVLSVMEDYFYRTRGPAMTAFENALGGRVVVMGYAPWLFVHSVAKRRQLQNAADWISRGSMPVRIDQTVPLIPVARVSADGRRAAVLLVNAGMDEIPEATVHARFATGRARVLSLGRAGRVKASRAEVIDGRLTIRSIEPWGLRAILADGAEV